MPLESKAQGRYLNWKFGHDWVKEHHFGGSQKGLPQRVRAMGGYGPNMPIMQGGPAARAMPRGMPLPFVRPTAPPPVQPPPYGAPPGAPPIGGGVPYGGGPIAPPAPVLRQFLGGGGYQGTNPLRKLATGHRGAITPRFGRGFNSAFMPRGFAGSAPRKMMARGGVAPASYHERVGGAVDPAVPTAPKPRRIRAARGFGGLGRDKSNYHQMILDAAAKYGADPRLMEAIARFETGNFSSRQWRGKRNPGGLSGGKGYQSFGSEQEGFDAMARLLASPRYKGKSVAQIAKIYAPVGAKNDPGGTNSQWARSVMRNMGNVAQGVTPHDTINDILGRNEGGKGTGAPTRKNIGNLLGTLAMFTPLAPFSPLIRMGARGVVGAIQRQGERKFARQHGYITRQVPTGRPVRLPSRTSERQGTRQSTRKARESFGAHRMDRYDPGEQFGNVPGEGFRQFDPREFTNTAANYNPMPREAPTDWSNIWQAPHEATTQGETQGATLGSNIPTSENVQPTSDYAYQDTSPAVSGGGGEDLPQNAPGGINTDSGQGTLDNPYIKYNQQDTPEGTMVNQGGVWARTTKAGAPMGGIPMGSNVPTSESVMPNVLSTYRAADDDTGDGGVTPTGGGGGGGAAGKKVNPLAHAMGAYDPKYNYGTPKLQWRPGAVGSSNPEAEAGAFGDYTLNNASMFGPNTNPTIGGLGSYGPTGGGGFYRSGTNLSMALPGSFTHIGGGGGAGSMMPFWSRMMAREARGPARPDWGSAIGQYARRMGSHRRYQGLYDPRAFRGGGRGGGGGGDAQRFGPNQRRMNTSSRGRVVRPAARPLKSYGSDTVPIAAKPGEVILNEKQKAAVAPIAGMEHHLLPEQIRALQMAKRSRRI